MMSMLWRGTDGDGHDHDGADDDDDDDGVAAMMT